jgi:hypothetical protein
MVYCRLRAKGIKQQNYTNTCRKNQLILFFSNWSLANPFVVRQAHDIRVFVHDFTVASVLPDRPAEQRRSIADE